MKGKIFSNKIVVALIAVFCCALWGVSTPIVKVGYNYLNAQHLPSLFLWLGLEFFTAGALTVLFYSLFNKKVVFPERNKLSSVFAISLLQTVLQYVLIYVGLLYTTSVKGAILKSTDVFFVALISSLILKMEKLDVKKIVSCVVGFLGIIVLNFNGLSLSFSPLGDGLVILGVFLYSFSVILVKKTSAEIPPIALSGYQMAIGGVILLLAGVLSGGTLDFCGMFPIFLSLAVIYAFSYPLWALLLKYNPASSVTIYSFTTPVFGVLSSVAFLDEGSGVSTVNLILALSLVCIGIILWGHERKKS